MVTARKLVSFVDAGDTLANNDDADTYVMGQALISAAPTDDHHIASKTYVDGLIASVTAGAVTVTSGSGLAKSGSNLSIVLGQGVVVDGSNNLTIKHDASLGFDGSNNLKVLSAPNPAALNDNTTIGSTATTAFTGANINLLTAGGQADALHHHAELVGTATVPTGQTWAVGDPLTYGSGGLIKADASTAANRVVAVVSAGAAAGGTATFKRKGVITGGATGGAAGGPVYLKEGGGSTATKPTTSGSQVQLVGVFINTTDYEIGFSRGQSNR